MYGLNTPDSDLDFTGVFHDRFEYVHPFVDRERTMTSDGSDYTLHTALKFAKMLVKGNFNAIDLVFHEPLVKEQFVDDLVTKARPYVLTQNVASAYMGYINSQRDRLVGHKPQSPERKELIKKLGYDPKYAMHLFRGMNSLHHLLETGDYLYLSGDLLVTLRNIKLGHYADHEVALLIDSFLPKLRESYGRNKEGLPSDEKLRDIVVEHFTVNPFIVVYSDEEMERLDSDVEKLILDNVWQMARGGK